MDCESQEKSGSSDAVCLDKARIGAECEEPRFERTETRIRSLVEDGFGVKIHIITYGVTLEFLSSGVFTRARGVGRTSDLRSQGGATAPGVGSMLA